MRRVSSAAALAALFLAALTLRPQIVAVGPLIPGIQDDLDTSHAVAGLLGTIPVLCMGLFAPVAAFLAARIGTRRAMTIGLALIGTFGILRALAPSAWLVVLLTWPVGIGMGLGNALAPIAVKDRFAARPATGTGTYATGIQLGAAAAAALAVPLGEWLGGWRGALIAISAVVLISLVAWVVLTRRDEPHAVPSSTVPRLPWRSGAAWLLVAVFATLSSAYYGLTAWLADAYIERGWSESSAGLLLSMMSLTAIPSGFVVAWLSDGRGGRRPYLLATSIVFIIGATGLVAAPGFAYGWALCAGIAQGGLFALVMTLPLDFEQRTEHVGSLVAMMLGLGYTIAALSPFLLGAVRDASGSYDAVLWVAVGLLCAQFLALLALPRSRFAAARAAAAGAER